MDILIEMIAAANGVRTELHTHLMSGHHFEGLRYSVSSREWYDQCSDHLYNITIITLKGIACDMHVM